MSRPGVTLDAVRQAALTLINNNEKPTIERVRRQLGGRGSNSTIGPKLKQLRLKGDIPQFEPIAAVSDPISPNHRATIKALQKSNRELQNTLEQTHSIYKDQLEDIDQERDMLQSSLKSVTEDNRRLHDKCEQYELSASKSQHQLNQLEQQLIAAQARFEQAGTDLQLLCQQTDKRVHELTTHYNKELARLLAENAAWQVRYDGDRQQGLTYQETLRHQYNVEVNAVQVTNDKLLMENHELKQKYDNECLQVARLKEVNVALKQSLNEKDEAV